MRRFLPLAAVLLLFSGCASNARILNDEVRADSPGAFVKLSQGMGLSMGGAIAAIFTARHPERVKRLGLVDPAGFPAVKLPFTAKLVKAPFLGGLLMGFMGTKVIKKCAAKSFYDPSHVDAFVEKFQEQMQYKGYKRSILSTLRHFDLNNQAGAFEEAGAHNKPTLLIPGRQDQVVPFENHEKVLAAMPGVEFHPIEHAGHIPHYERPETVSPLIADFFRRPLS